MSTDLDAAGATLVITPSHPLDPSAGAVNIGYMVLITSALKDSAGHAATPDADYETVRDGALADLVVALREYAQDWNDHLRTAPNHHQHWALVTLVELSDDTQLLEWLLDDGRPVAR